MQDQTAFSIGEIVHLNSGSPDLRVIAVIGEEIKVEWETQPGIFDTTTSPAVCFHRPKSSRESSI
jgi:hypothetical protein